MKRILAAITVISMITFVHADAQKTLKFPQGAISTFVLAPTQSADTITSVVNNVTYAYMTDTLAGSFSIKVTTGTGLKAGAVLYVKTTSGAIARTVTFSTGFTSPTLSGTANKSKLSTFVFDGTNFLHVADALLN